MGQDLVLATDAASGQILFHQRSNLDGNNFPIDLFQHEQVPHYYITRMFIEGGTDGTHFQFKNLTFCVR